MHVRYITSTSSIVLTAVLGTLETSEHVAHARFAPWPLTRFSTLTLAKFFVDSANRSLPYVVALSTDSDVTSALPASSSTSLRSTLIGFAL